MGLFLTGNIPEQVYGSW